MLWIVARLIIVIVFGSIIESDRVGGFMYRLRFCATLQVSVMVMVKFYTAQKRGTEITFSGRSFRAGFRPPRTFSNRNS